MPDDDIPIQIVTKVELQRMFNDNYWERIERGEFLRILMKEHLAPANSGEPDGTLSQIILYQTRDTHDDIILAHQYLRLDRTIGASHRPDPRWIVENGVMYTFQKRIITH